MFLVCQPEQLSQSATWQIATHRQLKASWLELACGDGYFNNNEDQWSPALPIQGI